MEGIVLKYLLDTSAWIHAVTFPAIIPDRVRKLLESEEAKGLSAISLLETAILHRLGRLKLDGSLSQFFNDGLSEDLELQELTPTIAVKTNSLPDDFQGDPFDRTIVATAAVLNLTLITSDARIREADACRVEFYPFKPSRAQK